MSSRVCSGIVEWMDGSTAKEASEGEERALTYLVGLKTLAGMPCILISVGFWFG